MRDKTWDRLQEWYSGQAAAERLAAQVTRAEGFVDIDPLHPMGGRDGGKDARCSRNGELWVMAAWFPAKGTSTYNDVLKKFEVDLAGARTNKAHGLVFVTNQYMVDGDRTKLENAARPTELLLLHGERVRDILDSPDMWPVRFKFLGLPAMNDSRIERRLTGVTVVTSLLPQVDRAYSRFVRTLSTGSRAIAAAHAEPWADAAWHALEVCIGVMAEQDIDAEIPHSAIRKAMDLVAADRLEDAIPEMESVREAIIGVHWE